MAAPFIRPYRESDLDALYEICVRTADAGGDARGQFSTDELVGDLFAAPYAVLEPHLAFVLDDGEGRAVGYVVGTSDTPEFAARYRDEWIPRLAHKYEPFEGEPQTPEETMMWLHHHPERMLTPEVADYPAHLHIDLLPDYQGKGFGRLLMERLYAALAADGADAVHLVMLTANTGARLFYDRLGFHEIAVPDAVDVTFLGRSTVL
jgi:ribosomal protein S18 acetylase RimI-like enzyme